MNENILDKIKYEEKHRLKRMFYFTSVPVIITVILFVFSYLKVRDANMKVNVLNIKTDSLNKELVLKSDSLQLLQQQYEFAINYKDERFRFGYSLDKILYSRYPEQTKMLSEMRQLIESENIKWKLGGHSINEGFDSPGFAAYIVNKYSKTSIPEDKIYSLSGYLQKKQQPDIGDLIIYEHGYTMVYFEHDQIPFCIGMTPVGLASLKLNFGPRIIGYYNVDY